MAPGLLDDRGNPDAPLFARPDRRLAGLGVIAFCALLAEGSVFDWSGVYLTTQAGTTARLAPLGLAAFSLFMGVGRLGGLLLGPTVIRVLADAAGLRSALGLACLLCAVAAALAGRALRCIAELSDRRRVVGFGAGGAREGPYQDHRSG